MRIFSGKTPRLSCRMPLLSSGKTSSPARRSQQAVMSKSLLPSGTCCFIFPLPCLAAGNLQKQVVEQLAELTRSVLRRQQTGDSFQRNAHPSGAIVEFVAEFVDSFSEQVDFQEFRSLRRAGRKIARSSSSFIVLAQKAICRAPAPRFRPSAKLGDLPTRNGTARRRRKQGSECRVVKRAQHSGNILQWRLLGAPLGQGPRRFSFKVDNHKIRAGIEHLPQMIDAVNADAHCLDWNV